MPVSLLNNTSFSYNESVTDNRRDNILQFKNQHKQLPVPFVIYAYFEAITEKVHACQPNDEKSYIEKYQKHIDCGYGYKVVSHYDDKYSKPVRIYRGENAVSKFMENMLEEVKWCQKPMKMKKATNCHICDKQYKDKDIRVRDHCQITGKYRGSSHQDCNINFRLTDKIPVIFHNLRG